MPILLDIFLYQKNGVAFRNFFSATHSTTHACTQQCRSTSRIGSTKITYILPVHDSFQSLTIYGLQQLPNNIWIHEEEHKVELCQKMTTCQTANMEWFKVYNFIQGMFKALDSTSITSSYFLTASKK